MKEKTYFIASAIVFTALAVLNIIKLAYGWTMQLGEIVVPVWASWVCLAITGYLGYIALRLELGK
ncbi:MAG: hypothetical protein Q8L29_04070 [archaeon]|nr:hypothetical protein [archaeon]